MKQYIVYIINNDHWILYLVNHLLKVKIFITLVIGVVCLRLVSATCFTRHLFSRKSAKAIPQGWCFSLMYCALCKRIMSPRWIVREGPKGPYFWNNYNTPFEWEIKVTSSVGYVDYNWNSPNFPASYYCWLYPISSLIHIYVDRWYFLYNQYSATGVGKFRAIPIYVCF